MADEQGEQQQKDGKKNIYEVGLSSIFVRNFIAGFARALGTIFVYLILGGLIYYLTVTYVMPNLRRILPSSLPLGIPSFQSPTEGAPEQYQRPPPYSVSPEQLEGAIELLQPVQRADEQEPSPQGNP